MCVWLVMFLVFFMVLLSEVFMVRECLWMLDVDFMICLRLCLDVVFIFCDIFFI